jgi:hypothetical protein
MDQKPLKKKKNKVINMSMDLITQEQLDILAENYWVWGTKNSINYAENSNENASIFGDMVEQFLIEEAKELLSLHYVPVVPLADKLAEDGYQIVSFEPLVFIDINGNTIKGSCADWFLRNFLDY